MTTFTFPGFISQVDSESALPPFEQISLEIVLDSAQSTAQYDVSLAAQDAVVADVDFAVGDLLVDTAIASRLGENTELFARNDTFPPFLSRTLNDAIVLVFPLMGDGSRVTTADSLDDATLAAVFQITGLDLNLDTPSGVRAFFLDNDLRGDPTAILPPNTAFPLAAATGVIVSEDDKLKTSESGNTLSGGLGNDDLTHDGAGTATLVGGEGNDFFIADNAAEIRGGRGNDFVQASEQADTIFGGDGVDDIRAGGGDDLIFAFTGNDGVEAGSGDDTVRGEDGNDRVFGVSGQDQIFGNTGDDTLYGGFGEDTLLGGQGVDLIFGGADADQIGGGRGPDVLRGNQGADVIFGNMGPDLLGGGAGNDTLFGGQGPDTLAGGTGDDDLHPGRGFDVIVFGVDQGRDTVFGFTPDVDLLLLDPALWGGNLTMAEVVAQFGRVEEGTALLRFDDVTEIRLMGLSTLDQLADAIEVA